MHFNDSRFFSRIRVYLIHKFVLTSVRAFHATTPYLAHPNKRNEQKNALRNEKKKYDTNQMKTIKWKTHWRLVIYLMIHGTNRKCFTQENTPILYTRFYVYIIFCRKFHIKRMSSSVSTRNNQKYVMVGVVEALMCYVREFLTHSIPFSRLQHGNGLFRFL